MISNRKSVIFAHIVAIKRAEYEQDLINIMINLTLSLDYICHANRFPRSFIATCSIVTIAIP